MTQNNKQKPAPPTIITLTLPTPASGGIPLGEESAFILIQRGELAHLCQFRYVLLDDLITAIREASEALGMLEENPPVIPDLPPDKPKPQPETRAKAAPIPAYDEEPTIDIPLKKGTKVVKISYLKIIGGESDAAAYRQAVLIAGKLVDGGLWDGELPIRIDDVYAVAKKMDCLTVKDLSLFTLDDFVQVGDVVENADTPPIVTPSHVEDTSDENPPVTDSVSLDGAESLDDGLRADDESDTTSSN